MDTIVALATPLGRSGVGVIRISGPDSLKIIQDLTNDKGFQPDARKAILKEFYSEDEIVDEGLVTYFPNPNSFTGEDVIEIAGHGSPVTLRLLVDACLRAGARLADPGEFSLRALSNGKMDLAQAEAIRDLIDANSVAMTRQAMRQLNGELSHQLQPFKDELLDDIVVLESALEFVEDDLPETQTNSLLERLRKLVKKTDQLASTFSAGKLLREGVRVALVGRPNVGKSSLFNALIGQESAIVTEIPGTTRDQLKESFTVSNIPVSLIDTAGLRETDDRVESIGVARARRAMTDADIVIVVLDGSEELTKEDDDILEETKDFERIIVFNKEDVFEENTPTLSEDFLNISAKERTGLEALEKKLIEPFAEGIEEAKGFVVSDARHHDLLNRTSGEI